MDQKFKLIKCPLTGLTVDNSLAYNNLFQQRIRYGLDYEGEYQVLEICHPLFYLLTKKSEFFPSVERKEDNRKQLYSYLPLFFGELGKGNFKDLFGKIIRWDCPPDPKNPSKHINIKSFVDEVLERGDYPKSRKEKSNLILKTISDEQDFDGDKILFI